MERPLLMLIRPEETAQEIRINHGRVRACVRMMSVAL